jgi:hypothetical protein
MLERFRFCRAFSGRSRRYWKIVNPRESLTLGQLFAKAHRTLKESSSREWRLIEKIDRHIKDRPPH